MEVLLNLELMLTLNVLMIESRNEVLRVSLDVLVSVLHDKHHEPRKKTLEPAILSLKLFSVESSSRFSKRHAFPVLLVSSSLEQDSE